MKASSQFMLDELFVEDIYPLRLARKLAREKRRAALARTRPKRRHRDDDNG